MSGDDRLIYRGAYFELPFLLQQRADDAALEVANWQLEADFRANDGDDVVLETSTALGQWVASTTDTGRIRFKLTEAETAALPLGTIAADVFVTNVSQGRTRLFSLSIAVRD